jgi:hypothetical protein
MGLRLALKSEKNKCKLKPLLFSGCYDCLIGAQLKFICATDFGSATAHIRCPSSSFSVRCEANGFTDTTTLAFERAVVDETCHVSCPAGSSTFNLRATLAYFENHKLATSTNIIIDKSIPATINFDFMAGWLNSNLMHSIVAIAIVIALVFLTLVFAQLCLPLLCNVLMYWKTKTQ